MTGRVRGSEPTPACSFRDAAVKLKASHTTSSRQAVAHGIQNAALSRPPARAVNTQCTARAPSTPIAVMSKVKTSSPAAAANHIERRVR